MTNVSIQIQKTHAFKTLRTVIQARSVLVMNAFSKLQHRIITSASINLLNELINPPFLCKTLWCHFSSVGGHSIASLMSGL